ncbi:MAG: membrane protein insertase YidC [Rickettsiales bacterium]|jgi:YidC/Oxa1 family membrane protein insertase|nr:membrane protein insertase YidC [Rickettsiales bacterium]
MEKNVTPGPGRPDFVRIFLIVLVAYLSFQLLFGKRRAAELAAASNAPAEITRSPVPFETATLKGSLNAIGLRVDDVKLKKYRTGVKPDSPNISMLSPKASGGTGPGPYVEFGFAPANPEDKTELPSNATKWAAAPRADGGHTLTWKSRDGVLFTREISFDDKYMLSVRDTVSNRGKKTLSVFPYGRVTGEFDAKSPPPAAHAGFVGAVAGNLEEITYRDLAKSSVMQFSDRDGWFGFSDVYFMNVLAPPRGNSTNVRIMPLSTDAETGIATFQADYVADRMTVAPGESKSVESRAYIGAKEPAALASYGIEKLPLAIDYGMFYLLTRPFVAMLGWLNSIAGNFGAAIILFTALVRLLLWPVAQKSFRSMEKIRKIQPEMKRIQAVYSGDKARMNMEIAALYKSHHINPLSGCLPILFQLPVFIALYKALIISIDMRQAPFALWIKDLSAADPTSIWNLFGLLPYAPWSWLPALGVLPILMGATMYAQQAMQPAAGMDQTGAKVMKFMPLVFTFIFAGLPSGLVLYWTVNNVLSILQQKMIK